MSERYTPSQATIRRLALAIRMKNHGHLYEQEEPGMLVLSRGEGEIIDIGTDITITVIRIQGDKVRLGITAPKDIPVHRREVTEAIAEESELPITRDYD